MGEINVAIADDNERILDLLGEIISSDKELNLVGKANNGEDVYHLIKEKQPDVVLLDLIMPKMDGLSVMEMERWIRDSRGAWGDLCGRPCGRRNEAGICGILFLPSEGL